MRDVEVAINPDFAKFVKMIEKENPSIAKLLGEKIDWVIVNELSTQKEFYKLNTRHLMVAELVINDLLLQVRNLKESNKILTSIVNAKVQKES